MWDASEVVREVGIDDFRVATEQLLVDHPPAGSSRSSHGGDEIADPHPDNLDRPLASIHGLGRRRRQPFVHEVDQQIGRESPISLPPGRCKRDK
jgi:hypothetical protein